MKLCRAVRVEAEPNRAQLDQTQSILGALASSEYNRRMRELIEQLAWIIEHNIGEDAAATGMDSQGFANDLQRRLQLKRGHLHVNVHNQFSKANDQAIVTYYRVPKGASGVDLMNNRSIWTIEGFSKQLGSGPPTGKVKLKVLVNGQSLVSDDVQRIRGKSGTPVKISEYLAKHIQKLDA